MSIGDPHRYEAWYHTPRGAWIGETEFELLMRLMRPVRGSSLLDAGSGTGYFSRKFAQAGLHVTGLDRDMSATAYALHSDGGVRYVIGSLESLPFNKEAFDYCSAVTSLCFISDVGRALSEMWRVARLGIVLGLLNRESLLYCRKHDRGGYHGARWDTRSDVEKWQAALRPRPCSARYATRVLFPGAGTCARIVERFLPKQLRWGGFLAVYLPRPSPRPDASRF